MPLISTEASFILGAESLTFPGNTSENSNLIPSICSIFDLYSSSKIACCKKISVCVSTGKLENTDWFPFANTGSYLSSYAFKYSIIFDLAAVKFPL